MVKTFTFKIYLFLKKVIKITKLTHKISYQNTKKKNPSQMKIKNAIENQFP